VVHADGSRPVVAVVAVIWIIRGRWDPAAQSRICGKLTMTRCFAGLIFSMPLITIGRRQAFGWMLAYLSGRHRHRPTE